MLVRDIKKGEERGCCTFYHLSDLEKSWKTVLNSSSLPNKAN
jgi:hypothetical protein